MLQSNAREKVALGSRFNLVHNWASYASRAHAIPPPSFLRNSGGTLEQLRITRILILLLDVTVHTIIEIREKYS